MSLLRDCYIAWPAARVDAWAWGYFELAVQSGVLRAELEADFLRWFDLMGVQRHLKAAGIFARLKHRDGKPGYLADIPRTLGYVVQVAARHPAVAALADFIAPRVLPQAGCAGGAWRHDSSCRPSMRDRVVQVAVAQRVGRAAFDQSGHGAKADARPAAGS